MSLDWREIRKRSGAYARLMRLHKPIGVLLLLWPTLWALWIASAGVPNTAVLLVFLLGTIGMRSAGCVINDFADRHIDGHIKRTKDRPLARGDVSPNEALILFAMLVLGCGSLVLTLNTLTIMLSFVAVGLAAIYPFMKRYTHLPQLFLGAAFGWAIPMAFAAQTGKVPTIAWLIFSAALLWTLIYDTEYAMVDRDDDIKIGVKSTAILLEDNDLFFIASLQILLIINLALVGRELQLGPPYGWGLGLCALLAMYQQWLIRERDPTKCFAAFMNNNWYGAVVFAGIAAHYYWSAGDGLH